MNTTRNNKAGILMMADRGENGPDWTRMRDAQRKAFEKQLSEEKKYVERLLAQNNDLIEKEKTRVTEITQLSEKMQDLMKLIQDQKNQIDMLKLENKNLSDLLREVSPQKSSPTLFRNK